MNIYMERKRNKFVVGVFILAVSCVSFSCQKKINPEQLEITAIDRQQAKFSPTKTELIPQRNDIAFLLTGQDPQITLQRLENIQNFLVYTFMKYGNFTTIPFQKVDTLIHSVEYENFRRKNILDVIQLGLDLQATFIAQKDISLIASRQNRDGTDVFQVDIRLAIYDVSSHQNVMTKVIRYDSSNPVKSEKLLRTEIQKHFPLRGYIVETRGNRQIGKISLGKSLGITLQREFHVRTRTVEQSVVDALVRRKVTFSRQPLATVKVVKILENESWVEILEKDRPAIRVGQVVFALPE